MLSIDSRNIFFFSLCLLLSCCCCCCVGRHPREKRERSKILEKDDEKTDPRGWNARRAFRIEITTRDENKSVARVESENLRRELSLPNRRVRCRARARARAVEKIEKNDQGRSRRRKTKETFQTAFLKSAPLPHSRRCRNSPRSSLLRPARSRRNRRPRTRCRRPNRTRFLLLLLLLLLSHSFFLFFFCALRSAVVVSLPSPSFFLLLSFSFFWPIFRVYEIKFVSAGHFLRLLWLKKKRRKREFLSTLFHSLGKILLSQSGVRQKKIRELADAFCFLSRHHRRGAHSSCRAKQREAKKKRRC